MLYIKKNPCPAHIQSDIDKRINTKEWASFPENPKPGQGPIMRDKYFNRLDKSAIRAALIPDQHGLCAYCMCRVVNDGGSTTIEHVIPLSRSKAGAMSYANWLAVCKGGQNVKKQGNKKNVLCCDVTKKDQIAALSPLNQAQMAHIAYCDDGTIIYNTPSGEEKRRMTDELNRIYGLNGIINPKTGHSQRDTATGIVKKRKDAYIAMYDLLMEMYTNNELTPELITGFRESLLSDKKWEPFVGVKLYVLDLFLDVLQGAAG